MTRLSKAQRSKFKKVVGSRLEVRNKTAHHTTGGLTAKDLYYNKKTGRIVSLKKHKTAKKEQRLRKYGYGSKKGKFGYVLLKGHHMKSHKKSRKSRKSRKTRRHRGGYAGASVLSPANFDGAGVGTSGEEIQAVAGQAGGRRSRRHKKGGHSSVSSPIGYSAYDGQGEGTSGVALQERAGQAGGNAVGDAVQNANMAAQSALEKLKSMVGGRRRRSRKKRKGGNSDEIPS